MAWLTTKFTCGHESVKRVSGEDREWNAPGPCRDCQYVEDVADAWADAADKGYPALTGTEKQINYGMIKRSEVIAGMEEHIGRLRPKSHDERAYVAGLRSAKEAIIKTQTSARWWIETNPIEALQSHLPEDAAAILARIRAEAKARKDAKAAEQAQREAKQAAQAAAEWEAEQAARAAAEQERKEVEAAVDASLAGVDVVSITLKTREDWIATLSDGRRVTGFIDGGEWQAYLVDEEPVRGPEADRITMQARQASRSDA